MPLEIERKFLVASFPTVWDVPHTTSHIVQTYLQIRNKKITSERVRVRIPTDGGPCVNTHTKKVRVADGVHEEDEKVIPKHALSRLLRRADPAMVAVAKTRTVFDWAGHTFEMDIFLSPFAGLVVLEVELPSMDTPVELPPFIGIVREVTTEREYTNAALARKGRWP